MRVKSLLVIVACTTLPALPGRADADCPGPAAETAPVRLARIDAAGDPVLADGRTIRLLGLAPRQDAEEATRFAAGLRPFLGHALELELRGEPDRWGRWPARLFVPPDPAGGNPQELARLLVRGGAALPLPEPGQQPCAPGTTTVHTSVTNARQAAPPIVVDGHDLAAVKAQEGRYVMLEGRVASVGERARRTYLNFSRRPKEAASIVVSRRLWRELQGAGWTAGSLGGKRLRAYGILSGRDGLLLEAGSRAALELID